MGRHASPPVKVRRRHGPAAGFGLIDALLALLLLSLTLLGAGASLVQSMRASHAATLQTRAVDLAADLAEDLQSVHTDTEAAAAVDSWRRRVPAALPVTGLVPMSYAEARIATSATTPGTARFDLLLRWRDPADRQTITLVMPVASSLPVEAP